MQQYSGRKAVKELSGRVTGLLFMAFLPAWVGSARSQEQEPPPAGEENVIIDIFPRYLPSEGYYEDAIIRTRDGRYLVYTGWYFDSLDDARLTGPTHQYRDFREFQSEIRARALAQEPLTHPYEQRVAPFARSLGIVVGRQYAGMTLFEVAADFGADLAGPSSAIGINRGIYGATPFNELPNQLTQVSGAINFGMMERAPVWQALRE